jgi:hypothetical protein
MKRDSKYPAPEDGPGSLWEQFGLPEPERQDGGPPVDREALQALVGKRLSPEDVRKVYRLTIRYRAWAEALAEIDLASLKRDLGQEEG